MEGNSFNNMGKKDEEIKVSKYKDILRKDDRAILDNNGQDLDELPIQIEVPELDGLKGNFDGE